MVRSCGNQSPLVDYEDEVRFEEGSKPLSDRDTGPSPHDFVEGFAQVVFGLNVDGAHGVVEEEDFRVLHKRASDGKSLSLPSAEGCASFTDDRIIAIGQTRDELVRLRPLRCFNAVAPS